MSNYQERAEVKKARSGALGLAERPLDGEAQGGVAVGPWARETLSEVS
ncbi:hypothetical protein [Populibacterium corticicola]